MPGPLELFIWCLGTALELFFVVCSVRRKSFFRYFFLNFYLLVSTASSIGRYSVLSTWGVKSSQYMYFYFYTDALLTLALYIALISLFSMVFGELQFGKYIRTTAVLLLLATALFTYAVVNQSANLLSTKFAYELSQNLYFVGLVLSYVLWGAVLKLRETRTRLIQFVLSLGVYFSAYAAIYALANLATTSNPFVQFAPSLLGCLLPLAWSMTMLRHTEESRLQTAQLVAVPR